MRGSISTSALILFVAFAATVAVLAYIVDMRAQWVLERDVESLAQSAADFAASQIRDSLAAASIPGVVELNRSLLVPRDFYGFDTAGVSICVGNRGGFLYVNVTASGTRGRGSATAKATAWLYNVTKWAIDHGRVVYLVGQYGPCGSPPSTCFATVIVGARKVAVVNLTRPGCSAMLVKSGVWIIPRG
ncbi:hypothetical protein Pcal_0083 [Pyrobaculum calidifontis JCM 11548]|uniref:Uncharacterized protein n=1 Tax=Pyrobaculum calidifontis (strain DSM 21063 / JCM 11548 / VA1) TaxID=410359 RepID=A3MSA6_PYRCJ|nr:hypothetical protein Pcal_0083 [Pyrobaculum calidifontis JCM 11548]